ncbi:MAG TPA: hypothetical protein VE757_00590, partial [Gaiellaceae bacterium]|nr:hypothetical protein [Gaiellaceae bacterium]
SRFAGAHGVAPASPVALDHGFQVGLYVLDGLLLVGLLVATLMRPATTPRVEAAPVEGDAAVLEEAA